MRSAWLGQGTRSSGVLAVAFRGLAGVPEAFNRAVSDDLHLGGERKRFSNSRRAPLVRGTAGWLRVLALCFLAVPLHPESFE